MMAALRETQSGGCGKVTPMGTGGLFATSRHSRLRRVHVVAHFATFRACVNREGEAGQTCVAAVRSNFALPKCRLLNDAAATRLRPVALRSHSSMTPHCWSSLSWPC